MPSQIPTYTNTTKPQYTGVSPIVIDEQARAIYTNILMAGSPLTIEKEIDELIEKGLVGELPIDDSISRLDSLLIIEGVLELYADYHTLSTEKEKEWYIPSVLVITNAIQVERTRLKKLRVTKIPKIPKTHIHVANILALTDH